MCSKCAKAESAKEQAAAAAAAPAPAPAAPTVPVVSEASAALPIPEAAAPAPEAAPVEPMAAPGAPPPNPGRCFTCAKKLSLAVRFSCRCGPTFCSEHRYADKHSCQFDYKGAAATLLTKANPVVAGSKLDRVRHWALPSPTPLLTASLPSDLKAGGRARNLVGGDRRSRRTGDYNGALPLSLLDERRHRRPTSFRVREMRFRRGVCG